MSRERKYLASRDDGHDYFQFGFYSEHRANSKAKTIKRDADDRKEIIGGSSLGSILGLKVSTET